MTAMSVPDPAPVTKPGGVEKTVLLAVTVTAPAAYTDADVNDAVAFHLGTTELNMIEADISAVDITSSALLCMAPGLYLVCSECRKVSMAAEVHFGPSGELRCGHCG